MSEPVRAEDHCEPAYDQWPRDQLPKHGPEVINSNCVEKVTQFKE